MRHLAITAIMLFLAACVPQSINPITPPESAKLDDSLFGTWYNQGEPDAGFLHIGAVRNGNGLLLVLIDFRKDDKTLDYLTCSGHTSRLDDNSYLNIKCDDHGKKDDYYIFLKYVVENGTILDVFLMEPSPVSDAIESGELKGKPGEGKGMQYSPPLITDEPQNIAEFIRKHDKELFKDSLGALPKLQLPAAKRKEGEGEQSAPEQDKDRQPGNTGTDGSSGQFPDPPPSD